jgi:hypothetical protein
MKRFLAIVGIAAIALPSVLASNSYAINDKWTVEVTNPGGQKPTGQQDKDPPAGPMDKSAKNPAGHESPGQNK